jgi:arylsulfatase A-like enzyme
VKGAGVMATPAGVIIPTSQVDLIPTLMGRAGIDTERAAAGVAEHHDEAEPRSGRDAAHGIPKNPLSGPSADPLFERHNLSADPEERDNRVDDPKDALSPLTSLLDSQRDAERLLPYTGIRRLSWSTTNRHRFRGPSRGRP